MFLFRNNNVLFLFSVYSQNRIIYPIIYWKNFPKTNKYATTSGRNIIILTKLERMFGFDE